MVLHLARVGPGIVVHSGFKVLPGKNVATQAQADNPVLGKVAPITAGDLAFMEGVLEVNHAFASGYPALERRSPTAVHGIGINPGTFFNPTETLPVVGGVRASRPSFRNRIIGPVTLDDPLSTLEALMGDSISLRADEGYPFHIGRLAAMGDSVTFHALEHTDIEVGDGCSFGTGSLVHGGSDAGNAPRERTQIGDAVAVGDGSIVFRSTLGHDCVIGSRALVDGSQLAPGTVVPSGTILIDNVSQGQIEW